MDQDKRGGSGGAAHQGEVILADEDARGGGNIVPGGLVDARLEECLSCHQPCLLQHHDVAWRDLRASRHKIRIRKKKKNECMIHSNLAPAGGWRSEN